MNVDYNTDFFLWTQQQAAFLRQGVLSDIDMANLAEEIESMGKRDRRAVGSYLANILLHLLKWCYQPQCRSASWEDSIDNGREQVEWLVKDSPSLRTQLNLLIDEVYPRARRKASRETELPLTAFPEQCPFTVEQVIEDYWPELKSP